MSTFNEEKEMEVLMQSAPLNNQMPIELKAKLRGLATTAKPSRFALWPGRLMMLSAGLGAAVVAVMIMTPASASAKSFAKVLNAMNQASTFQFSVSSNEGGKQEKVQI